MNAENPADTVIEAVALAISKHRHGSQETWDEDRRLARALHAAGLLADPADRDEEAIGRAVEIIARMSWEGPEQEWPLWRDATEDDRQRIREKVQPIAETLADEALLTNPDEFVSSWAAGKERARAERAEAERDHAKEVAELAEEDRRTYHRDAIRAEAEVAELRQKWLTFTSALGFGNNRTEPAAELSEMIDPIERAFSDARDHQECAVICELCGDPLAAKTCDECHGSGCLPNSRLAYLECGTCAGVGKVHEGCVEKSYAELVAEVAELEHRLAQTEMALSDAMSAEVAELRATVERCKALADEWERALSDTLRVEIDELRAALDGSGQ